MCCREPPREHMESERRSSPKRTVSFRQRCVVEVETGRSGLFRVLTGRLDSEEQLVPFVMLAGWRRASAREGLIE